MDIHERISEHLRTLDGSTASLVSLLTGASRDELEDLGGFGPSTLTIDSTGGK